MSKPVLIISLVSALLVPLVAGKLIGPRQVWALAGQVETASPNASPSIDRLTISRLIHPRGSLGLGGRDPVELVETGTALAGQETFASNYDGQTYRFGSAETKARFDANPSNYAPVLAGDSMVAWVDRKELKGGKPEIFSIYGGKIFLFANEEEKRTFDANPKNYFESDLLLQGFSPVSLVDDEALRRGTTEFQVNVDGWRILLSDEEEVAKFKADPGRYFPTLAGIDPVAAAGGNPLPGLARFSVVYKNRLYATSSTENREKFIAQPDPYSEFDVALEGLCPVALLEEKKKVPGHYGISTIFRGQRYLFASDASRKRFLDDPAKYVPEGPAEATGSR